MLYHYIAADKEGKLVEADYDAETLTDVLRRLSLEELRPISVKPLKQSRMMFLRMGKITLTDKVFLTKYLALMLRVGTDLLSATNILIADCDKPAMKNFLLEVRENLSKGRPFNEAFAKHPKSFSPVFISLVKAADASGNLQGTFENLSLSLEKEAELRGKIKSAFIYPIIILSASLAIFIFLTTFALPRIAKVFDQGGLEPPLFSRIVFSVGLFFGEHVFGVLLTTFALLAGAFYFFFKNKAGKRIGERIVRRLPVIRKVHQEASLQRFASTFSALLRAGLPIIDAVKISAEVVGSEEYRFALIRIADEGLAKGLTVGDAFRREVAFPRVLINLVAISEKAGHLEEVLETLADFYAASVDAGVKAVISLLEPILLLFMGILVGGIALSIIVPIYQLTSQF